MEKTTYSRFVAIKTTINELLQGTYVQENEENSNYVLTQKQEKLFRVNILAIILDKEKQGAITNLLVEDGTGKIILRSFEEDPRLAELKVGDVILFVGKPRIYNQEQYVSPEIIKKTSPLWLKARVLELKISLQKPTPENEMQEEPIEKTIKDTKNIKSEEPSNQIQLSQDEEKVGLEEKTEEVMLPVQKILQLIKELDLGEGAMVDEIIEKSPIVNSEQLIEKMLEKGEIFQISPGKVKVL